MFHKHFMFHQIPLSKAERQRQYRERKKLKEGGNYLEKERERKRKYYVPAKDLPEPELLRRRSEVVERVKRCMRRKRERNQSS